MSEPIQVYQLRPLPECLNHAPAAVVVTISDGKKLSSVTTEDITPEGIELAADLAVKAANRANGKGRF